MHQTDVSLVFSFSHLREKKKVSGWISPHISAIAIKDAVRLEAGQA